MYFSRGIGGRLELRGPNKNWGIGTRIVGPALFEARQSVTFTLNLVIWRVWMVWFGWFGWFGIRVLDQKARLLHLVLGLASISLSNQFLFGGSDLFISAQEKARTCKPDGSGMAPHVS